MAVAASAPRLPNTVSRLHQYVSQEMWQGFAAAATWEIPITSITNGTHLLTWLNGDFAMLYDQYLQPDWRERYNEPQTWNWCATFRPASFGRRTSGGSVG